jgi:GAF domain-containing protein
MDTRQFNEALEKNVAPLDAVLRLNTTGRRRARVPGSAAEEAMHRSLAVGLDERPESVLDAIATAAAGWCKAGSAAISRLETDRDGKKRFRWNPVAGRLANQRNYTTPASFSPCQVCFDRDEAVLFAFPERRFTYLQRLNVAFVEMLVVPLRAGDRVAGTLWIAAHAVGRRFDTHDAGTVARLAGLAGVALQRTAGG